MNITNPRPTLRSSAAIVIWAALMMSVTTISSAADFGAGADAPRKTVRYADLDISSPQGATVAYGRIQAAARTVCQPLEGSDLVSKMRRSGCVRKAVADAVRKVDQQALSAVYAKR